MKELIKNNWKYWLKSSAFTFFTVALPVFVVDIKAVPFETLETAGMWGAGAIILRLALKASWYGVVAFFIWLSSKLSKKPSA